MKNYPLNDSVLYRDMKALVYGSAERFGDKPIYSYRKNPRDKEVIAKSANQFKADVTALGTQLIVEELVGKHCAIIGGISYNWVLAYHTLLSIGAVAVPLDKEWSAEDLADTVKRSDAEYLICDRDIAEKAKAIAKEAGISSIVYMSLDEGEDTLMAKVALGKEKLDAGDKSFDGVEIDPEKLALLVFTSGTTGKGKGVMLSQKNLLSNLYAALAALDVYDKSIGCIPPHHTYGTNIVYTGHLYAGANLYLSGGLRHIQNELKNEKPKHMVLVPLYMETFYRKIIATAQKNGKDKLLFRMIKVSNFLRKLGIDLRRKFFKSALEAFGGELQLVICGGAPISQKLIDFFESIGVTMLNGYGITECSPLVAANRNRYRVAESVGVPVAKMTVKIAAPNENGEGEICVKGDSVMLGYYKEPELTAAAFDEEGYFKTGDIGKFEKDVLKITGRIKNLIILANGKNVYPEEIESDLSTVEGVLDVIVYEGKSRRGIEHNAIVLEIYPDYDLFKAKGIDDVDGYFKRHVDSYNKTTVSYKKIDIVRVRKDPFPKNTLRKIKRFELDMTID